MNDFTKAFAPVMLAEEITITISKSDYGRISSGEDVTYTYNGVEYEVFYDGGTGQFYFMIGDTIYILEP